MSVTYEAVGSSSANFNACAPTPPAGSGTGLLAPTIWGNADDAPLAYYDAAWTLKGDTEGGAGAWAVDSGTRHISALWTDQAVTGPQTFTNGGVNDGTNLTIGYILRFAKTLTYWDHPVVASAADNAGGSGFSATFNHDPGFTDGDVAVLILAANTDAVNPATIALTLPGTTQGTGTTAIVTSPFSTGHDARITIRYVTITGTSDGTPPSVTSSTDFTGPAMLIRLRDTNTEPTPAPVVALGGDATVEPWLPFPLNGSASTYSPGATFAWTVAPGNTGSAVIEDPTALDTVARVSPTLWADEDYEFELTITDAGGVDSATVTKTVLRASEAIRLGGVDRPLRLMTD